MFFGDEEDETVLKPWKREKDEMIEGNTFFPLILRNM